jgi:tetratricopeptide (TPR) repeat protein
MTVRTHIFMKLSKIATIGGILLFISQISRSQTVPDTVQTKPLVSTQKTLEERSTDVSFVGDMDQVEATIRAAIAQRNKDAVHPQSATDEEKAVAVEMAKVKELNTTMKELVVPHEEQVLECKRDVECLSSSGDKELAKSTSSWQGYDYKAMASMLKGDADASLAEYTQAFNVAPAAMKGWYKAMMGTCYTMKKDKENLDKALEQFDAAIADGNNWIAIKTAHLNEAAIYLLRKNYPAFSENIDKFFAMAPAPERKVIAESDICKQALSAGLNTKGCVQQSTENSKTATN